MCCWDVKLVVKNETKIAPLLNGILNESVMMMLTKNIIKFLLIFTTLNVFSQEPSFYIRSLRSIHIENKPSVLQPVSFNDVDVVYNKIAQFINHKIVIRSEEHTSELQSRPHLVC